MMSLMMYAALFCAILAAWRWRQRRLVAAGTRCWNCGADLRQVRFQVDGKGPSRCPKCGDEMDVNDVYEFPES